MKADDRVTHITRETIQQLVCEDVAARRTSAATEALGPGDEYLDLAHLSDGVHRSTTTGTTPPDMLLRRTVSAETWAKIVRHLPVPLPVKGRSASRR